MSRFVEYSRFGAPTRAVRDNGRAVEVQSKHQGRPFGRIFTARHRVRRNSVVVRNAGLHRSICAADTQNAF